VEPAAAHRARPRPRHRDRSRARGGGEERRPAHPRAAGHRGRRGHGDLEGRLPGPALRTALSTCTERGWSVRGGRHA